MDNRGGGEDFSGINEERRRDAIEGREPKSTRIWWRRRANAEQLWLERKFKDSDKFSLVTC